MVSAIDCALRDGLSGLLARNGGCAPPLERSISKGVDSRGGDRCCGHGSRCVEDQGGSQCQTQTPCECDQEGATARTLTEMRKVWKEKKPKGGSADVATGKRQMNLGLPPIDEFYVRDRQGAPDIMNGISMASECNGGLRRYIHRQSLQPKAVLRVKKTDIPLHVTQEDLERHLQVLCKLDHPNIVCFRECCEDAETLSLVYDWCDGGSFLQQLWRFKNSFSEAHMAKMMREVIAAIVAAAAFEVHHLDLNLFCILLTNPEHLSPVRVFGFGLATFLLTPVSQRKHSGTRRFLYCAPELFVSNPINLASNTKHACDMWSVGAILYALCCGRPPWGALKFEEIKHRVIRSSCSYPYGVEFAQYSHSLINFLQPLLQRLPNKRPTGKNALLHAWVTNDAETLNSKSSKLFAEALGQLSAHINSNHVKQTVARMLTEVGVNAKTYNEFEDKFREMDINGDGTISADELRLAARQIGLSGKQFDAVVAKVDRNGNKTIDVTEFVSAVLMEQEVVDERLVREAWSRLDTDSSARVSKKQLFTVLRQYSGSMQLSEVSQFVNEADCDGDGMVDYMEFKGLFPKRKGLYEDIYKRSSLASLVIQNAPMWLERFKDALEPWLQELDALMAKYNTARAGSVREEWEKFEANNNRGESYLDGEIGEYDVQAMVHEMALLLQNVPGQKKTQRGSKGGQRTSRKKRGEAATTVNLDSPDEAKKGMGSSLGISRLVSSSEAAFGDFSGQEPDPTSARGRASLADGIRGGAKRQWELMVEKERQVRPRDVENSPDSFFFSHLYWLVKIKSSRVWEPPIYDMIDHMRANHTDTIYDVEVMRADELYRMQSVMTPTMIVHESTRLREGVFLEKGWRMLPLNCMAHAVFGTRNAQVRMEKMKLPAIFSFGIVKDDGRQKTPEVIADMESKKRNAHLTALKMAADHAARILNEVDQLLQGVDEDLQMSTCMETPLRDYPPVSESFLKYCEGRQIKVELGTPSETSFEEYATEEEREHEEMTELDGSATEPDSPDSPWRKSTTSVRAGLANHRSSTGTGSNRPSNYTEVKRLTRSTVIANRRRPTMERTSIMALQREYARTSA